MSIKYSSIANLCAFKSNYIVITFCIRYNHINYLLNHLCDVKQIFNSIARQYNKNDILIKIFLYMKVFKLEIIRTQFHEKNSFSNTSIL
jgi:hypothetical protein